MAEVTLTLENFWSLREQLPLVDARSEGEFAQSYIPGAINIPILNNAERVQVGTLYKQAGPEKATLKGFELVGPRFHLIQREALRKFPAKKLIDWLEDTKPTEVLPLMQFENRIPLSYWVEKQVLPKQYCFKS